MKTIYKLSLVLFALVSIFSFASSVSAQVFANFAIEPQHPFVGEDVDIYYNSASAGEIDNYVWEINGEVVLSGPDAQKLFNNSGSDKYVFTQAGEYNITLTITDTDADETDSIEKQITVRETSQGNPVANFTYSPSSPVSGQEVTFTSSATDSDGFVQDYRWFVDFTLIEQDAQEFRYSFNSPGEYIVLHEVEDNDGYQNRVEKAIIVREGSIDDDNDTDTEENEDQENRGVQSREYDVNTDYGSGGLVPCNGIDCDFNSFIELLNKVIEWIFYTAVVVATIMFAYAGWLYMSSGGNPQKISTAHNIFKKTAIGLIIIALAWLIVNTIVSSLLDTDNGFWTILG